MRTGYLKLGHASAVLLLLAGCATMQPKRGQVTDDLGTTVIPYAEAVNRIFPTVCQATTNCGHGQPVAPRSADAKPANGATVLTLAGVQGIARAQNPTFAEFAASRQAARAEVLQALAYPNPDIEADLDYTLGWFLPIEFPSKRRARRNAAEASGPVVEREEDEFRVTLAADAAKAYHTVLYYQRAVELAAEVVKTEHEIEQIVGRRIEAGEAPEIDRIKAQVETLKASRVAQAQQRHAASARAVLNALCGRALPPDFVLEDALDRPLAGLNIEQAQQIALAQHPVLRRLEAVLRQKELIVQRERKAWYPSIRIGVPLGFEAPLLNRNKGGVAAAEADLQKTQAALARARQEIQRDIETAVQTYESAREQLAAFQGGLRAAAAESLRIETFLYQEGEVDFLQLLDARRTARQTEAEYLQVLFDTQIACIEIERAIGIGGEKE